MGGEDLGGEMRGVLAAAARRVGLAVGDARLIRLHSSALFALPDSQVLVRIATNPDALPGVTAAIRITRWLADRGYPCTTPADIDDQPFLESGRVVSFWRLLPVIAEPPPTATDLARLLRTLHDQPLPPGPLRRLTDPFASVSAAVAHTPHTLTDAHRQWLTERITELRRTWSQLEFPHSPRLIHGDAHGGNLIRLRDGAALLGDWDHVAVGPREWDLIQAHYTARRFRHPPPRELDAFAHTYGWDIRHWPAHDTLIAVREVTGLSSYLRVSVSNPSIATELTHRLTTLEQGDVAAMWRRPGHVVSRPASSEGAQPHPRG